MHGTALFDRVQEWQRGEGRQVFSHGYDNKLGANSLYLGDSLRDLQTITEGRSSVCLKLNGKRILTLIGSSVVPMRTQIVSLMWQTLQMIQEVKIIYITNCPACANFGRCYAMPPPTNHTIKNDIIHLFGTTQESVEKAPLIVYHGSHVTPQAKLADLILPHEAPSEQESLYFSPDGHVWLSSSTQFLDEAVRPLGVSLAALTGYLRCSPRPSGRLLEANFWNHPLESFTLSRVKTWDGVYGYTLAALEDTAFRRFTITTCQ